ncbi:mitochondrial ATP synthase g subunit-domain-containing protein [Catenaria anguillulae PL171]|uniref:Mitochondrial ATP synthase g subunit-domain-containing protein n=1 Tax=Catenaria anguillulae PL171 TaxID=765915 RepID=A0A1Y2HHH4_9FUNG|nr:mitochondrial ATP synthase g subunit-domain-containing protein [Catenaria anguillulae PL171]
MSSFVQKAQSFAQAGLRRAYSVAQNVNAQQAQQAAGKIASKFEPVIYYGKVGGEIAKQVYHAEKLAPPTQAMLGEAQAVGLQLVQSVRQGAYKKWSQKDMIKGAVLAGEAFTFFLLGEIVGRRSLIGYSN